MQIAQEDVENAVKPGQVVKVEELAKQESGEMGLYELS